MDYLDEEEDVSSSDSNVQTEKSSSQKAKNPSNKKYSAKDKNDKKKSTKQKCEDKMKDIIHRMALDCTTLEAFNAIKQEYVKFVSTAGMLKDEGTRCIQYLDE